MILRLIALLIFTLGMIILCNVVSMIVNYLMKGWWK